MSEPAAEPAVSADSAPSEPPKPSKPPAAGPRRASRGRSRRRWTFRLAAVLVGLLPFVVLEAGLRLFDLGRPARQLDPFVGFSKLHPQFALSEDGRTYATTQPRTLFFGRQEFAAHKPANGFRAFCLGGSTVRGRPYTVDSAFAKWMQLQLSACDPSTKYEIVNCGGLSYASYRLTPLVEEVLGYEPDLIVIATGHNEFLEDRTYRSIKEKSAARMWVEDKLYSLRTVTAARQLWDSWKQDHADDLPQLPDRLKTQLDNPSGYASYHRDEGWRANVVRHFNISLHTMVGLCRKRNVPVVLVRLGSNVRDCPPFKSEHKAGLSAADERRWQQLFDDATTAETGDLKRALELYRRAAAIDDQYALLSFRLARCYDRLKQYEQAGRCYVRAKELDVCPLRMLETMADDVTAVAEETGTPLIDARGLFERQSPQGIPGSNVFMDHVHPTMAGHQQIARAIVETLHEGGLLPKSYRPWTAVRRRQVYRRHFQRLGPRHFSVANEQIGWLEGWARRQRLASEITPVDVRGHLHEGHRRLNLGEPALAWKHYKTAIARDPHAAQRLLQHALSLFQQGRTREAEELVLTLRPLTGGAQRARLDLARLVIAVELDDRPAALLVLNESAREFASIVDDSQWAQVMPDVLDRARKLAEPAGGD